MRAIVRQDNESHLTLCCEKCGQSFRLRSLASAGDPPKFETTCACGGGLLVLQNDLDDAPPLVQPATRFIEEEIPFHYLLKSR